MLDCFAGLAREVDERKEKVDKVCRATEKILLNSHERMLKQFQPEKLKEIIAAFKNVPSDDTLAQYADQIHAFSEYMNAVDAIEDTFTLAGFRGVPGEIKDSMESLKTYFSDFRRMAKRLEMVEPPYYEKIDPDDPAAAKALTEMDRNYNVSIYQVSHPAQGMTSRFFYKTDWS